MGLHKVLQRIAHWRVVLVIALLCVCIAAFGDAARELLRYERVAIAEGEYWRLLSAHFAHLGYPHQALNLAGL